MLIAQNLVRTLAFAVTGLLLSGLVAAQEVCPLPEMENVSFSDVAALKNRSPDKVIAYGDSPLQFGELWLPSSATPEYPAPLVVFVHGGCWLNAFSIDHSRAFSEHLAASGYAVWSIEYRRTGDEGGGWPGSYEDVLRGINHVNQLSDSRIDKSKIALSGHSAGGHLVLLAASDTELNLQADIVIGLAPIVDLKAYALGDNSCQVATPQFMGGPPNQRMEDYTVANPSERVALYPVISIHGDQDAIVPTAQSLDHLKTQIVEGAGHFDLIHPHTPAFQALLKALAKNL